MIIKQIKHYKQKMHDMGPCKAGRAVLVRTVRTPRQYIQKKLFSYRLERMVNSVKTQQLNVNSLRTKTLSFVESMRVQGKPTGRYRYSKSQKIPVLYASIYAALTRHLYKDLHILTDIEKEDWISYINMFQCDDGLFRDPAVSNEIAETGVWWGWPHMTLHIIMALTALGGIVAREFSLLDPLLNPDVLVKWLETRDWDNNACNVSNEVQNVGTLLQYSRDFHNNKRAGKAVDCLLDWLEKTQNSETGSWKYPSDKPENRSLIVQTGYHLWLLFFYDKRNVNYAEEIIDSALTAQSKLGGFGVALNSSACEDIDAIDPLVRMLMITDYRYDEVLTVLKRGLPWVLTNMNEDGGFVFRRGESFLYGHDFMSSMSDESAMFPTWFRTLSLAYLAKALPGSFVGHFDWQFLQCPGHQFWND
jgi:hypothetical protein